MSLPVGFVEAVTTWVNHERTARDSACPLASVDLPLVADRSTVTLPQNCQCVRTDRLERIRLAVSFARTGAVDCSRPHILRDPDNHLFLRLVLFHTHTILLPAD